MIDLLRDIQVAQGPVNVYKSVLIEFTKTHNSFRLSDDVVESLHYQAKRGQKYADQRGGKLCFAEALLQAYLSPKTQDDPYTFLQRVTRIS